MLSLESINKGNNLSASLEHVSKEMRDSSSRVVKQNRAKPVLKQQAHYRGEEAPLCEEHTVVYFDLQSCLLHTLFNSLFIYLFTLLSTTLYSI